MARREDQVFDGHRELGCAVAKGARTLRHILSAENIFETVGKKSPSGTWAWARGRPERRRRLSAGARTRCALAARTHPDVRRATAPARAAGRLAPTPAKG